MKNPVIFSPKESLIQAWDNLQTMVIGENLFLSDAKNEVSYKEINALAHCLGAYLISKNIQKNDVVFILTENNIKSCMIDLATCICGAKRVFLSDLELLESAFNQFSPKTILVSSEETYQKNREYLLSIAAKTEILVQIKDTYDIPEGEPIATIETVLERGKIFWRENAELIRERKNNIKSYDCSLIVKGLNGWNQVNHGLIIKGIDVFAKNYATEQFPKILSSIFHTDNLGMMASWWMASLTGKKIHLSDHISLDLIKQTKAQLWVATAEQLVQIKNEIESKSWKSYYHSVIQSGQTLIKNRTEGKPNPFGLKFKCWVNGWYYRKLKYKYLKSLNGILVKHQDLPVLTDAFYELLKTPVLSVWMEDGWACPAIMTHFSDRKIGSVGRLVFENSIQTTSKDTSIKTRFFYSDGPESEHYDTCFEVKNANYFIKYKN